jgi:hypothetical protein
MRNKPFQKKRIPNRDDYFYVQKGTETRATWITVKVPDWVKPGMLVKIGPQDHKLPRIITLTAVNSTKQAIGRTINTQISSCVALVVRVDKEKDYLDIIWKDEVGRFVPGSDFKIELTSSPEL